jgi:exodeoxyribonuclease VII large subunit
MFELFSRAANGMEPEVWTVAALTRHIRQTIELDWRLQDLWLEGEVSNLTQAASGHLYFTLKDESAQIKCVMWREQAVLLPALPERGDMVLAHGKVSVYELRGEYQLYCDALRPAGLVGDLHRRFEQLKARLEAEGLFDPARKRPLPRFPRQIGVVTSPTAAAFQDIQNVLRRRWPAVEVILRPAQVQGAEAPPQIVAALEALNAQAQADVIILARGGGSLEDLWAFNDEQVVRAVAASRIPVVSGVGHETDFTLADFAADVRAPTPSAAAELVTPDREEYLAALLALAERLGRAVRQALDERRRALEEEGRALRHLSPAVRLQSARQQVDELMARLSRRMQAELGLRRERLAGARAALQAVSPLATLARGYAVVTRAADGHLLTDAADAPPGTDVHARLHRGGLLARVRERSDGDAGEERGDG